MYIVHCSALYEHVVMGKRGKNNSFERLCLPCKVRVTTSVFFKPEHRLLSENNIKDTAHIVICRNRKWTYNNLQAKGKGWRCTHHKAKGINYI